MHGYTIHHDRGDMLPTDAMLPSPFAVLGDDQAAIGRELAAFHRGWGSADSEAATRLALAHAAERLLTIRKEQGDAHTSHLTLHVDLEDRVKAGVFPLPAGAAHAEPWALRQMFLTVARTAWAAWCVKQAERAAQAVSDAQLEAEDAELARLFDEDGIAADEAHDAAEREAA